MRCAIYTRKSVEDDFQKEQTSLESQRINCEKYAESRGWEIIPTLYEDYGRTGANMDREGFQRLLNDIRAGKIDCVVVYKLDRLTRSLMDFVNVIDGFFKEHHVSFVSATESFDTTTPVGTLVMTLLVVFAQFERQQTSLRVKDKIRTSRTQGIWTGGFIPLGYKSVDRKLEMDPQAAPWVRYIFDEYIKTGSLMQIVRVLNEMFPLEKYNMSLFNYERLRTMIKNPIYKGYLPYKNEIYKGRHEAIISEETWQQANELLKTRFSSYPKKDSQFLLKGLFKCEACQRSMTPSFTKKGPHIYRYYICLNKQKGNAYQCEGHHINADLMESLITKEVWKIFKNPELFDGLWDDLKEHTQDPIQSYETLRNIGEAWDLLTEEEKRPLIRSLVKEVVLGKEHFVLRLTTRHLKMILESLVISEGKEKIYEIDIPGKIIIKGDKHQAFKAPQHKYLNSPLEENVLQAFLQAQLWEDELQKGIYKSVEDLAKAYHIHPRTVLRYKKFLQLSPKVQEAILNETLSPQFRIVDFTRKKIPDDWEKQDQMFGV